jgi:hypothetical protein
VHPHFGLGIPVLVWGSPNQNGDPQTKMGCLIATSEDNDDNDGGGAMGDKVDNDGETMATAQRAGGNWLEGHAEARRVSHECRANIII